MNPQALLSTSRLIPALLRPLALATALAPLVVPAMATTVSDPIVWSMAEGGNGHAYAYVDAATDWTTAHRDALALSHEGVQGHLATVSSAAENAFLGLLAIDGWLGGSDATEEGVWRWVDGTEAGQTFWLGGADGSATAYASWQPGEPNNYGDEDYLHRAGGTWNDYPSWRTLGYYVEYDLAPTTGQAPEPGGLLLVAAGLLALVGAQRRASRVPADQGTGAAQPVAQELAA